MEKTSILYVEDEPFLGRIVRESLESRNYTVHMATDGADAIDLYKNVQPNICVLDVMLPNKDGYSIALGIRAVEVSVNQ